MVFEGVPVCYCFMISPAHACRDLFIESSMDEWDLGVTRAERSSVKDAASRSGQTPAKVRVHVT